MSSETCDDVHCSGPLESCVVKGGIPTCECDRHCTPEEKNSGNLWIMLNVQHNIYCMARMPVVKKKLHSTFAAGFERKNKIFRQKCNVTQLKLVPKEETSCYDLEDCQSL